MAKSVRVWSMGGFLALVGFAGAGQAQQGFSTLIQPCESWLYNNTLNAYVCQFRPFHKEIYLAPEMDHIIDALQKRIDDLEERVKKLEEK